MFSLTSYPCYVSVDGVDTHLVGWETRVSMAHGHGYYHYPGYRYVCSQGRDHGHGHDRGHGHRHVRSIVHEYFSSVLVSQKLREFIANWTPAAGKGLTAFYPALTSF